MREANAALTWSGATSVSLGATSNSDAIFIEQECLISIQIEWTAGSPVGDFTLETSCDVGPATGITNWTTYSGSTQAAGGATGTFVWRVANIPDRWIRVTYTRTSASGTLAGRFQAKGAV